MGKLTDLAVKHARPGKHSDGENLYLVVKSTGTRSWQFWFRRSGRRREMGLGSYPTVKLVDARRAALGARVILAQGGDPPNERNAAAKARCGASTGCPR
ncbi:Arm DNA-binding domain-containing protein [Brevundimonas sp.]|uniref:Arm DNA-binding domain-containing protein n=1 Tax=Brevundimonas sp. TaxID=1871086 RepID=UPI003F714B81